MTEILLHLCKLFVSYDRVKTEKIGDFFVLTWLIFAGPVTYYTMTDVSLHVLIIETIQQIFNKVM